MRIPTPTVGEIIVEEFLIPLHISPAMFANKFTGLLDGSVKITPEISKQLADYFGMSNLFFFKLQLDIDNRNTKFFLEVF